MKKGLIVLLVLGAIVLIGGCQACSLQKSLVNLDENVKKEWAGVENAYQRRADLIPNLVSTVKGAAAHEQNTLTAVIEARSKATQITVDPNNLTEEKLQEFQQAQGQLSQALGKLMMIREAYPDLKVNQNFLALQDQLEGTENRINEERRKFNDAVNLYNKEVRVFPNNMLAGMLNFKVRPTFKAEAGAETAPKVEF